jgi:hypothetical protein
MVERELAKQCKRVSSVPCVLQAIYDSDEDSSAEDQDDIATVIGGDLVCYSRQKPFVRDR